MATEIKTTTNGQPVAPAGGTQLDGAFTLGANEVVVRGEPTFADWERAWAFTRRAESGVMWWIGDLLNYGAKSPWAEKCAAAAAATGLSEETRRVARWVAEKVPSVMRITRLSFNHHQLVAALDPAEQERWLGTAEREGWKLAELRKAIREERRQAARAAAGPIPEGQYRVFYADPPWEYTDELIAGYGAAEHHYPTLSVEELCGLPVSGRAAADSVVFLWATVPVLPEALRVVAAWGFEYKTHFVWDKVRHNFGHYSSVRHELLLLCTRGSCLPDSKELHDSVVCVERTEEHSEKPEEFRHLIDGLYTWGPRLELFARTRREGWDSWGNET
jgi:N6-adenosine-specific RNA methylase IME4